MPVGVYEAMRLLTGSARRSRRWLPAVATVAVIVLGGSVSWWAIARAGGDRGRGSEPTCAAVLVLAGDTYRGYGDPRRVPRTGARVGTATIPACSDTNGQPAEPAGHVAVFEIPGVGAKTAVLADGGIWLRRGARQLPARLRVLYAPVRCTSTGRFTVAGTLTGISPTATGDDAHVRTPYRAELTADHGPASLLDGYSRVTIAARVTSATKSGRDSRLLRAALSGGRRVSVTMRCAGDRFEAVSLRLTR